ncbi:serine hydrolase domain-containing protein [Chryseobacterium jejuense]|uniref:CubicO group peptidase, beta-lactamase class C family n=1 Tax=Chryseobacterium jejuense TaxID=445960 RepID=A0A2X2XM43_CHRJE|nr:serine hydrolase domain-containing protein [Chryseobacterium jejuense]SDI90284.1 CubicO group peptidase, beta-lactamase class C family [Chryseobacterium jejuense]SQB27450.1 Penicillin-binding protein E [Chryseobacterium jejuense]
MKQFIVTALALSVSIVAYAQKTDQSALIDQYVKEVMAINQIPGLAIGIIKDDQIIFQQYYGKETLENDKKVDSNSMFRIYSTSKLMSNIAAFQLIEKGQLSLEDKISKYLENLPKEWQEVQVKNLLTHSSGIPNLIAFNDISANDSNAQVIERLSKEKMDFKTGQQFSYNQTNYFLLTMIIEKVTGQSFENFILNNQFSDTKNQVVFSSNAIEKIPHRVVKYNYNSERKQYEKSTDISGTRAHSANGIAITLTAFLKWSSHLSKNNLLHQKTKEMMWQPFDFGNKKDVFAYGWDISKVNNITSYNFSGGNVSSYKIYPQNKMAIVMMSNGYSLFPIQYRVVNHIAAMIDKTLTDDYSIAEETIISEFSKKNNPGAEKIYYSLKAKNPKWNFENTLNDIGYILLRNSRTDEAIKVFTINVKENPQSANSFDSLGEGYFSDQNYVLALENYKESLVLNPENTNASKMIQKIEDLMKKK